MCKFIPSALLAPRRSPPPLPLVGIRGVGPSAEATAVIFVFVEPLLSSWELILGGDDGDGNIRSQRLTFSSLYTEDDLEA